MVAEEEGEMLLEQGKVTHKVEAHAAHVQLAHLRPDVEGLAAERASESMDGGEIIKENQRRTCSRRP